MVIDGRPPYFAATTNNLWAEFRAYTGWPGKNANLNDPVSAELAKALSARMPAGSIVLLHRHSIGDTLFVTDDKQPIVIPALTGMARNPA